jgi:hypothetical protein
MKNYTRNLNCILCALAMMLGLFLLTNRSNAQSQGPNSPVWVLNITNNCMSCPGATWSGLQAGEAQDDSFLVTTLRPYGSCYNDWCYYSTEFTPSDYYFNVPMSATITGIEVIVYKKASYDSAIVDNLVQLMNDDSLVGVPRTLPGYWTKTNTAYHYGGSKDLWGYNWTPEMVNSQYFGMWIKAENKKEWEQKAYIDWVGITVYYTTNTTGIATIASSSSNNIGVLYNIANTDLTLSSNFSESIPSSTITIIDMLGQVQFKKDLANISKGNNKTDIKTSALAPGIYIVEFTGGGKDLVKKMVVVR